MGDMIVGGSDIAPLLSSRDIELFDAVDKVIEQSVLMQDPSRAFDFGRALWKDNHLKGLALAKYIYKLSISWDNFKHSGMEDRFEDAINAEVGITPQTSRKYSRMWEYVFENPELPEDTKKKLYGKPIKSLLLLTSVARDGEDVEWQEVLDATTHNEIREIVRTARGKAGSSETAIRIVLQRDGTLKITKGWRSEDSKTIGHLVVDKLDDPDIKKAIDRIVNSAGVIWQ